MRKIIEATLVTLDGVVGNQVQFSRGYFDEEMKASSLADLHDVDLFLLGRKSYEAFAPVWSKNVSDAYFDAINALPKVVVSHTLQSATWNAEVLGGDVADGLARLKEKPGKNILKYGTNRLSKVLYEHRLVDELRLAVIPVVAHSGLRLFENIETAGLRLELREQKRFANGVLMNRYIPHWESA